MCLMTKEAGIRAQRSGAGFRYRDTPRKNWCMIRERLNESNPCSHSSGMDRDLDLSGSEQPFAGHGTGQPPSQSNFVIIRAGVKSGMKPNTRG